MIFTGFLPNATRYDLKLALGFLCLPWRWQAWRQGKAISKIEEWLRDYFSVPSACTFDSGRTALQKALEALGVESGDEVLVQAYTCVVVSNAILWTGAKPVYIDIDSDFNLDPDNLKNKITPRAKVLIIQHTFGQPAKLDQLLAIAHKYNLKVVEDCAHSLGVSHQGQLTGTWGDIGMFSFGSDKIVSCVRGGALITKDRNLGEKIKQLQQNLPLPKRKKVGQYLANFPAFALGKPLYRLGIGKLFLGLLKKLNITGRIIYEKEKQGLPVSFFPAKLANALATILQNQLQQLEKSNQHRLAISKIYHKEIKNKKMLPAMNNDRTFLRYTLQIDNPEEVQQTAKQQGIILGDWYNTVIAPRSCNLKKTNYISGSCPHAERLAQRSINLPTHRYITKADAKKIANFINKYAYYRN